MKVSRIQHSLKDLNKDIGNCERQLSQVLKNKGQGEPGCTQSGAALRKSLSKPGNRHSSLSPFISNGAKAYTDIQRVRRSRSPERNAENGERRSVICKEIIGDQHAPTRVEVVVRTKSCKKRSRSAQLCHSEQEFPLSGQSFKNNMRGSHSFGKNSSWGDILQQQNLSSQNGKRKGKQQAKLCAKLNYSSTDDEHSSIQLEKWVQSIPESKSRSSLKSSSRIMFGNQQRQDINDSRHSLFNPLRTLNFLVKELRGKVHKDYDGNMQRIIEDMEKALRCIPLDSYQTVLSVQSASKPASSHSQPLNKPNGQSTTASAGGRVQDASRGIKRPPNHEQIQADLDSSTNLVNRLMTSVTRIMKIGRCADKEKIEPHLSHKGGWSEMKPSIEGATGGLQAQLEVACKQLEETCLQMEDTCENLRQQKIQLLEELKCKTQQLEAASAKNQQLTVYAADVRQELLHVQQAAEMAQQEHEKLKQSFQTQQRSLLDSNSTVNQRLNEALQENERLATELQLCRLEKDKMHILMSNKDLEVARLKKDIVDINALVTEQLANLRALSGKKCSLDKLDKMMQAFSILHDTVDGSVNSSFLPVTPLGKDSCGNHIGDGEGSRSRPICSSPTSSANSSLYNSWHLLSDIASATEKTPDEQRLDRAVGSVPKEPNARKGDNAVHLDQKSKQGTRKISDQHIQHKVDVVSEKQNLSARDLKAGLQDMFNELKKQTSEAVNITLPSPPRIFDKMEDTLGVSQWTELSASESTVLLHSSDESDVDD